jgi:hypothetical protein
MVSYSFFSSSCKWYVLSLLYKNRIDAYLCWAGWFEVYGMTVNVNMGFLCMEITQLVGVLWSVMSKKFILLSDSVPAVNFMLRWILLKSVGQLSRSSLLSVSFTAPNYCRSGVLLYITFGQQSCSTLLLVNCPRSTLLSVSSPVLHYCWSTFPALHYCRSAFPLQVTVGQLSHSSLYSFSFPAPNYC